MSSANLRLRLFGPPAVTGADGVPVGGGSLEPHRLALLALLALHPKRTASRTEITSVLWPTRSVEEGRHALNQALFGISKALGDDAIFASAKEVRLGGQVSVDALEFQAALEAGRPDDAMQLYKAPLLEDFELEDAPEFDEWAASQRGRFATAARTKRPVAAVDAIEVSHDLAEPDKPDPAPIIPPREEPTRKAPPAKEQKKPDPPADFELLAEPDLRAPVERASDGPALRAKVAAEPELLTNTPVEQHPPASAAPADLDLMTNEVLPEPEPAPSIEPPRFEAPVDVAPPQPAPPQEVQWITPDEPPPPAIEARPPAAAAAPPPPPSAPPAAPEVVPPAGAPPAPVESKPEERRAKRPRRPFPRPSARLVATVVVLVALGAVAYMARGWMGAARGGIDAARGGIAAVRGRADAALQAREKKRSIAVLPIEYSGRNQADVALAGRVVEELGPMLTRAGLIVAPSTDLTRRGPPYDLRVLADSLNVAHVLQGVMSREGAGLAFRFRLVDPVDGTARWEDTYRPKLADIPVLQEDVAATVAGHILRPSERD